MVHIRKYFSTRITRTLSNALVLSRIDYCGSLLSDTNSTDIKNKTGFFALLYDLCIMLNAATICVQICTNIILVDFI